MVFSHRCHSRACLTIVDVFNLHFKRSRAIWSTYPTHCPSLCFDDESSDLPESHCTIVFPSSDRRTSKTDSSWWHSTRTVHLQRCLHRIRRNPTGAWLEDRSSISVLFFSDAEKVPIRNHQSSSHVNPISLPRITCEQIRRPRSGENGSLRVQWWRRRRRGGRLSESQTVLCLVWCFLWLNTVISSLLKTGLS